MNGEVVVASQDSWQSFLVHGRAAFSDSGLYDGRMGLLHVSWGNSVGRAWRGRSGSDSPIKRTRTCASSGHDPEWPFCGRRLRRG
jgi:hypothetical protein